LRPKEHLQDLLASATITRSIILRNIFMQISARNVLKGTVKSVNHGAVNSEVVIELPGGQEIVSVITKSSAEQLELEEGKAVCAVVKASNVMLAIE
jgi:molybdopterin-binding protein